MSINENDFFNLFDFIRENSFKPALYSIVLEKFKYLNIEELTLKLIIQLVIENLTLDNEMILILIEKFNVDINYNIRVEIESDIHMKKGIVNICFSYLSNFLQFRLLDFDKIIQWKESLKPFDTTNLKIVDNNSEDFSIQFIPKQNGYLIPASVVDEKPLKFLLGGILRYIGRMEISGHKKMMIDFQKMEDLEKIFIFFKDFI